jgi:predicted methyltransferase
MKLHTITLGAMLLAASACSKSEPKAKPAPKAEVAKPDTTPKPDPAAEAEAKKKQEDAERVAKAHIDADAAAAKERERWTADMEKQAAALSAKKFKNTAAAMKEILASPHRTPGHPDRDAHRHPTETLTFFGVQPTSTVVELGAGGGWYTEVLAPLLVGRGKLVVAGPDAKGPADAMSSVYGKRLDLFLAKSPAMFGKVERTALTPPDKLTLTADGSADVVLAIREMHNWQRNGFLAAYLKAVHAALKPGGVFGVVAHRAAPGTDVATIADKGYLPEAWVIEQVEAAGFKLAEKSEINANPKDTKDYEPGVWALPPAYRLGDVDKAKYTAIGESDRMTLKFVKK